MDDTGIHEGTVHVLIEVYPGAAKERLNRWIRQLPFTAPGPVVAVSADVGP